MQSKKKHHNDGRVMTLVFRVKDGEKFAPLFDSSLNGSSDTVQMITWAEGNALLEQERQINLWHHFAEEKLANGCSKFDEVFEGLAVKEGWENTDDWPIDYCIERMAEVWQPPEYESF